MVKKSRDVTRMNWKQFMNLFFDCHFPRAEQDKLASEFNKLEQVSMKFRNSITLCKNFTLKLLMGVSVKQENVIVDEYSVKFDRLSRFAPHLVPWRQMLLRSSSGVSTL